MFLISLYYGSITISLFVFSVKYRILNLSQLSVALYWPCIMLFQNVWYGFCPFCICFFGLLTSLLVCQLIDLDVCWLLTFLENFVGVAQG